MFTCQFGRYRYKRLPFGVAPTGDMFQRKIDEIFKDLPNVCGIADDILVVCFDIDGKDHDDRLQKVLQRCSQVNLKSDKGKCHFRCTQDTGSIFLGEILSRNGVKPDPQKQ